MKPLSFRISTVLTFLLLTQLFIVGIGFYIAYEHYTEQTKDETYQFVTSLDPIAYEAVVLQTIEGNYEARDVLSYDIIETNHLRFAAFYSTSEIQTYLQNYRWQEPCELKSNKLPKLCLKKDTNTAVGIIPIQDSGKLYGFFVQEADQRQIQATASYTAFTYVVYALFITFCLNVLGIWLYFRLSINRELSSLMEFLNRVQRKGEYSYENLPKLHTREYVQVRDAIIDGMRSLKEVETEKRKIAAEMEKTKIASQVAHDIRSPLTALNVILGQLPQVPEEKRLIVRSAVNRIRDIANNLLSQTRSLQATIGGVADEEPKSVRLLSSLIESIITEKRTQYRSKFDLHIEAEMGKSAYGIFAKVQPNNLKRVLSNLINNAVEAIEGPGQVTVSVEGNNQYAKIYVKDNGKGIPESVLPTLMEKGRSFNKEGGHGLGLHHAKTMVESWRGEIKILSQESVGTTVEITLPQAEPPTWFVDQLKFKPGSKVAILDDDNSIHEIWRGRFKSIHLDQHNVESLHFSTPFHLEEWVKNDGMKSDDVTYLVDYEFLGESKNGLDLIESLGIHKSSILVTSRYEEKNVSDRCQKLGVRLIPKGVAGYVPTSII